MNVTDLESIQIDAKICGSARRRSIAYSIMDNYRSLYLNKRDIILAQISACELLYKCSTKGFDKHVLKKEISDLKLILDLIE